MVCQELVKDVLGTQIFGAGQTGQVLTNLRENPQGESQVDPVDLGKTGEGKALVFIRKVEYGTRRKEGQ